MNFLGTVTEGVLNRVPRCIKVVIRSYFGVIQRHKVSGGTGCFATVSQVRI